ncbi:alkylated DNA nucleotide flippase Atl1 [Arthrobacter sp. CAN_A2]|uniref:MGMT family protein n=1 Tax=Arthrobacter sp. CAN_A2 TaxID=2787718 RepID=UPI0018EFA9FA
MDRRAPDGEDLGGRRAHPDPGAAPAVDPGTDVAPHTDPDDYGDAVLAVAGLIPAGRVLTYGDIAELLDRGGPRQVGRALSRSTRDVPWWRVLRAGGHPPRGLALRARAHYDVEGTPLSASRGSTDPGEYRVDLCSARWWPTDEEQVLIDDVGASLRRAGS